MDRGFGRLEETLLDEFRSVAARRIDYPLFFSLSLSPLTADHEGQTAQHFPLQHEEVR